MKNPALDMYVDVIRDVNVLKKFRESQMIQRARWDLIALDIRTRMIKQEYVMVEKNRVLLTEYGLEVLEYNEVTA